MDPISLEFHYSPIMAAASFQQYKEMGESLGLSGVDLADYVTKHLHLGV